MSKKETPVGKTGASTNNSTTTLHDLTHVPQPSKPAQSIPVLSPIYPNGNSQAGLIVVTSWSHLPDSEQAWLGREYLKLLGAVEYGRALDPTAHPDSPAPYKAIDTLFQRRPDLSRVSQEAFEEWEEMFQTCTGWNPSDPPERHLGGPITAEAS